MSDEDSCVRVAVRIRPQIPREVIDMCRVCTSVTPGEPQVTLGSDKSFTFDYVFDVDDQQATVYDTCVSRLVEGALKGYNATVLAYGQTGSGKTYSMGTGFDIDVTPQAEGIIPRAVRHLFSGIEELQNGPENARFSVAAQFMELYNEEVIDLLDPYSKGRVFKIHEDISGGISVAGATLKPVNGPQDALRCLQAGALARTTASTQMNAQSSRSHALFTLLIRQQRVINDEESETPDGDLQTLTAKFHFVDLAGSERLKRTGATGERAREGISINCGLLALGNVISALGDKSKKALHVPYRDSKLTRLLQDSLGGNSQTLMIACVSPSDRDFMETLNTLKYANRARNIKNRVILNQDQSSRTIGQLRRELAQLQMELLEYKQGKRSVDAEGNGTLTDTFHENALLSAELQRLRQRLRALQETVSNLTERNTELLAERASAMWSQRGGGGGEGDSLEMSGMIRGYIKEIEELRARLLETDSMYQQLKKASIQQQKALNRGLGNYIMGDEENSIIEEAKRELEREREVLLSRSLVGVNNAMENEINDGETQQNDSISDSEEDSDEDSDEKEVEMGAELAELSHDIDMKQKLIAQLEVSQQRLCTMRQHYEDKLAVLSAKISDTQKERDQVLANIGNQSFAPSDKVKKVKEEYERKLSDMQRELRRLQYAQKEHARLQRSQAQSELQLRSIRAEVNEMKRAKVKLINKMKEAHQKHKEEESRRVREIAQLRKESRKNANTIRTLQADRLAKEQVLKRKTEEVSALRKGQRENILSRKAAGRLLPSPRNNQRSNGVTHPVNIFSPREARQKWEALQRSIARTARSRQAAAGLERELERLLGERDALGRELERLKRTRTLNESAAEERDNVETHLRYLQDGIAEVQHAIMELEEGKEENNELTPLQTIIGNISSVDEARFLLEKLCGTAISQACDVAVNENKLKEKEALLTEVQQDSTIQQQLLEHVLLQTPNEVPGSLSASTCSNGQSPGSSRGSSRSTSPTHGDNSKSNSINKVRCRTVLPSELLFGTISANDHTKENDQAKENGMQNSDIMTRSYHQDQQAASNGNSHRGQPLARVPSAPGSLKGLMPMRHLDQSRPSPLLARRNIDSPNGLLSPRLTRRSFGSTTPGSKPAPAIDGDMTATPPGSPPAYKRFISREDDVFARLAGPGGSLSEVQTAGSIKEYTGKTSIKNPLHCTHIVDGHNSPVLSVKATADKLFTAASDRTVKVWNLQTGSSPLCLSGHPGPVVDVAYDPPSGLLYSASGPFVRVWDLRATKLRPIKTLCSSGATLSGTANLTQQTPGEVPINALALGNTGSLYVAASDKVRIWDLRKMSCIGKLSGGHQAAVMCIAISENEAGNDTVVTGSKDHFIKVFDVGAQGGLVTPSMNLEPPHYDGIQALCIIENSLFSGSRDAGLKHWNLKTGELYQSLNNVHKNWVSGLAYWKARPGSKNTNGVLLSSCRDGVIRLWDAKTCEALSEMRTDAGPINDVSTNNSRIFTASNDGKVRIWRLIKIHQSPDR